MELSIFFDYFNSSWIPFYYRQYLIDEKLDKLKEKMDMSEWQLITVKVNRNKTTDLLFAINIHCYL